MGVGSGEQDKLFLFRTVHETDNRCLGTKQDINFLSDKKSYICLTVDKCLKREMDKNCLAFAGHLFLASTLLVIARFSFFFDIEIKKGSLLIKREFEFFKPTFLL